MKEYAGKVLMFVENRYPYDMRVRNEATALSDAGYKVTVIGLGSKNDKRYEIVSGVAAYRIPTVTLFNKTNKNDATPFKKLISSVKTLIGYIFEYSYFTMGSFIVSLFVYAKERFDVVHLHNPPDTLFIIALFYKFLGKKIVFDHHDLSPELYLSRYYIKPDEGGTVYRTLLLLEKFNLKLADVIIATNESYRDNDIQRGKLNVRKVFVVRNGPDLNRMKLMPPDERTVRMGKKILVYIGVMGPQDGVDYLLRSIHCLVYDLDRNDFYCILIGKGDSLDDLKALAVELKITDYIWFTGFIPEEDLLRYLSTADICVDPDPSSPLNNVSTWIKIMEYMALEKPIVTFDLKETRYSAQDAALYVRPNDELGFAQAIVDLMDNPELRKKMGKLGRMRIEQELQWDIVKHNLLNAYKSLSH